MQNRNMSDIIEAYLKQALKESEDQDVEIRRNEIAERFQCVPSQINYVIKTRFTPQQGYVIQSKRGGGGYIRIIKLKVVDGAEYIEKLQEAIGDELSVRDAETIIKNLEKNNLLTSNEAAIFYSALDKDVMANFEEPDQARAVICKHMLERLKYRK